LKSEFKNEFQPIGYSIGNFKNKLQNDLKTISSFVTEIEYLCNCVVKDDMKKEDICVYILKRIREPNYTQFRFMITEGII